MKRVISASAVLVAALLLTIGAADAPRYCAARIAVALLLCAAPMAQAQEDPGKAVYARACQVCHGEEGRGDAGPALVPLEKDVDEVLAIVREGIGQMPPIAVERLSDDDVRRIVGYLKSLKPALALNNPPRRRSDAEVVAQLNGPGESLE